MANTNAASLRVYIDIDGTILYGPPSENVPEGLEFQHVCDGLGEFLGFVVQHCQPYWLSYPSRLGQTTALEARLFPHLPEVAATIPAACWRSLKSDAIDPAIPFLWFDDDVDSEDERWLVQNSLGANLIRVDHERRDNPAIMLECVKNRLAELARHS